MLPETAKVYFESLWTRQSADAWSNLSKRQRDFERVEIARGHSLSGSGYAARLSSIYKEDLTHRARVIVETLRRVHWDFDSPLDEGVAGQLCEWGARAVDDARDGLEVAYVQHLQRLGLQNIHPIELEYAYASARAAVHNELTHQLWEQRNVPRRHPHHQRSGAPVTVMNTFNNTINNSGTIGAVQTGPGAVADVQQQWIQGSSSDLREALGALRDALNGAQELDSEARRGLVGNIDNAIAELQQERSNVQRLLAWLGGIGAAVDTIASIQPAYEAVKAWARALGIPLP